MSISALRVVIRRHLKSQVATARVVGVSPQAVSEILRRGKRARTRSEAEGIAARPLINVAR